VIGRRAFARICRLGRLEIEAIGNASSQDAMTLSLGLSWRILVPGVHLPNMGSTRNKVSISVLRLEFEVIDLLVFEQGGIGDRRIGSLRIEGGVLIMSDLQRRSTLVATH